MISNQLREVGLSEHGAQVYSFLTSAGASSASLIARQTKIQRTLVYILLKELIKEGLVEKDITKKVARFKITNPSNLIKLLEQKEQASEAARNAYNSLAAELNKQFSIQSGQPGITFYEGIRGLRHVYNDINNSGVKELLVVRSRIVPTDEMREVISEQVKKQMQLGISVRLINSTDDDSITKYLSLDGERTTERRIVSSEVFKNPAQILIYGDKIAFTTYRNPMVTVVIEHTDIAETLQSMYEIIWIKTRAETQTIKKKLLAEAANA